MVNGVVIHNQPVRFCTQGINCGAGLLRVLLPGGPKPPRMVGGIPSLNSYSGYRQSPHSMAVPLEQVAKMALVLAADEQYGRTLLTQCIRQRQTTHNVTGSYVNGRIHSKSCLHD